MKKKAANPHNRQNNIIFGAIGLFIGAIIGFVAPRLFNRDSSYETLEEPTMKPIYSKNPSSQGKQYDDDDGDDMTKSKANNEIDDIICPITQEIMKDPYISKVCGHSFEKVAIFNWLTKKQTCPKCYKAFTKDDLIQNYNLRNVIDQLMSC